MEIKDVSELSKTVLGEVSKAIVGKKNVSRKVMISVLANGHILFEDFPGLAKTLMANSFADALGCEFRRVQFTPDLLPADVTGSFVYNRKDGEFILRKGPVFTNILLADEINRAPPKTQSALLEAMQERQTTLEGETYPLPEPFIVMATQNPIEYEGTYPLPEAQVDRFLIQISIGYPEEEEEKEILKRRMQRKKDEVDIKPVINPQKLKEMQTAVENIYLDDAVLDYITAIVKGTREHNQVDVGASPRGSLALMKLSRARAALDGRDYVLPDDVKYVSISALSHRIILKPESWVRGVKPTSVVKKVMQQTPVPKVK